MDAPREPAQAICALDGDQGRYRQADGSQAEADEGGMKAGMKPSPDAAARNGGNMRLPAPKNMLKIVSVRTSLLLSESSNSASLML